jgi:hypothetical protein
MDSKLSWSEFVDSIAGMVVGVGLFLFVLFPFAVPALALTIAAVLVLALPLVALGAVAAILTGMWLGIRATGRGIRRLRRPPGGAAPTAFTVRPRPLG